MIAGAMRVIAIEEHFSTPMFREKVGANEFRNFYLSARSEELGHDIAAEMADLGAGGIRKMDAAGIALQVFSFGSPGPQASDARKGAAPRPLRGVRRPRHSGSAGRGG